MINSLDGTTYQYIGILKIPLLKDMIVLMRI